MNNNVEERESVEAPSSPAAEPLRAPQFRITPCSPHRSRIHSGDRARVWCADPLPEGVFAIEDDRSCYTVRVDGKREVRTVYRRARHGVHPSAFHSDRYEASSFVPVRVLAIAKVSR